MRNRLLGCLAYLGFLAAATSADAQYCWDVCTPTSSCGQSCLAPAGPDVYYWTACGAWGLCGDCILNYVIVQETQVGARCRLAHHGPPFNSYTSWHFQNEYRSTWRDVNNCGVPDYTTCRAEEVTNAGCYVFNTEEQCCAYWGCWGGGCNPGWYWLPSCSVRAAGRTAYRHALAAGSPCGSSAQRRPARVEVRAAYQRYFFMSGRCQRR